MNVRRWRRAWMAVVALVAGGTIGLAVPAAPAGAAPSSSLQYSTDGGTTWSSNVTVTPGATVSVRQWFDNDGTGPVAGAQLGTTLPSALTRVAGSTQLCLNPSTTDPSAPNAAELRCSDPDEAAAWTGSTLAVSPTAGLFGASASDTSGTLAAGRKRYFNLRMCQVRVSGVGDDRSTVYVSPTDPSSSLASNTIGTSPNCIWGAPLDNSGVQPFDLLGNRYVNIRQCRWVGPTPLANTSLTASPTSPDWAVGSSASNVADTTVDCAASPRAGWTVDPDYSATAAFDVLNNRYLSLYTCGFVFSTPQSNPPKAPMFWILKRNSDTLPLSYASDVTSSDPVYRCGTQPSGWSQLSAGRTSIDLLDTARGRGYVTYDVTVPTSLSSTECNDLAGASLQVVHQDAALTAGALGSPASSSGTITVDWSAEDPCPGLGVPLLDLRVGAAALLAIVAAAWFVSGRRAHAV